MIDTFDKLNKYLEVMNGKLSLISEERYFYWKSGNDYFISSVIMDGKSTPYCIFADNRMFKLDIFLSDKLSELGFKDSYIEKSKIHTDNTILNLEDEIVNITNNLTELQDTYDCLDEENEENRLEIIKLTDSLEKQTNATSFMLNLINYILKTM